MRRERPCKRADRPSRSRGAFAGRLPRRRSRSVERTPRHARLRGIRVAGRARHSRPAELVRLLSYHLRLVRRPPKVCPHSANRFARARRGAAARGAARVRSRSGACRAGAAGRTGGPGCRSRGRDKRSLPRCVTSRGIHVEGLAVGLRDGVRPAGRQRSQLPLLGQLVRQRPELAQRVCEASKLSGALPARTVHSSEDAL